MRYSAEELDLMTRGADIIAVKWLHLRKLEQVLIVTTTTHYDEAMLMKNRFLEISNTVDMMVMEERGKKVGQFFDENYDAFDKYNVIVGAADYSIVTTRAAQRAIDKGSKFLSLPLSTNDGRSMLSYDFLMMDTKKSRLMAGVIKKYLDNSSVVRVTTKLGTDLKFWKRNRTPGFFNGDVNDGKGFSSASLELYIPIEETMTEGLLVLDGSLGYIGKVEKPFNIVIKGGRITEIEDTSDGRRLREYLESFDDPGMYVGGELGIGLNSFSKCCGNCYIEDESSYGTFHIGFGRNIALGGIHEASGHFDLVTFEPDIFADNRMIIQKGKIIVPEPQVY